jgi:hypothetical protein
MSAKSAAMLVAAAGLAIACERQERAFDSAGRPTQTYSEAADELAADVAADAPDVSAPGDKTRRAD